MNMTNAFKNSFRNVLTVAALSTALGLSLNPAFAADATAQPPSDGVASTLKDAAITTKVKAKLIADGGLKKSDIHVSTFNGVVALSGTATTAAAKSLAESDVKNVDDVKGVDASALVVSGK
ncbi:MAG: hypothetical protein JWM03_719 [Rhodocyclales bacterium]|nr:hypothetical protein [Rhodocyclales bacterium]MDB5887847.1 hypothetical protein [Rhodocyclales bacterium]